MAKNKVLKKNHKLEGDSVVITETVERTMSKEELFREKQNCQQRKAGIVQQMKNFKLQYEQIDNAEKEIDTLIESFGSEELPEIPKQ